MLSPSPTLPAGPAMDLMAPVTHHQNVLPREELPLEHVLLHSEFVVSSPSPAETAVVPITPTPSSLPSQPVLTLTPAPTPSVKPTLMYAN